MNKKNYNEERNCYKFNGCFTFKEGKNTNLYLFFTDKNEDHFLTKANGNGFLEKIYFDNFDDFKMCLNDYASIKKMDFLLPKKTFVKESNNENIHVSKNDLISSEMFYVNSVKTLYNFITNERSNIMENTLNGYIKLIGNLKDGDNISYDFYFEDENEQLYKINVSYNDYNQFSIVKNLQSNIEKISLKDFHADKFDGQFFVPKNVEDVLINVDEIEGILTPKGCEIGSVMAFNTDFVSIFENQMYIIGKERVQTILSLNKNDFEELVDGIRDINLESIDITEDIMENFAQLEDIPSFEAEEYVEKPRTDKYGNRLNAFGNYADYDDYR